MSSQSEAAGSPPDWVADTVFYQIFPDRFARATGAPELPHLEPWDSAPTNHGFKGGDLRGIAEHLDHLSGLGVGAIYLNPIFASASNHRYHTYDYFRVDPLLGGDAAFDHLLAAAHDRGIRIILDGVFNHVGRGFWAFHHVLECGESSPYRDWFRIHGFPLRAYDRRGKPNYDAWWDLRALPELVVSNPDTREHLLAVAEHWTRRGIDGWRLDVPEEIPDRAFWQEFRTRVRAIRPDAYLVGEIWTEAPAWLEGDRFDATMNYPLGRVILGLCATKVRAGAKPGGHPIEKLDAPAAAVAIQRLLALYRPEVTRSQLNLLGSHDTHRILTLVGGDHRSIELAALVQMTLPGAPCIYYGDEVGLAGGKDPACRHAFPWREAVWHRPTLDVHRDAIRVRREHRALRHGRFEVLLARGRLLVYALEDGDERIAIALNTGSARANAACPAPALATTAARELMRVGEPVWSIAPGPTPDEAASLILELPPRSALIVLLR